MIMKLSPHTPLPPEHPRRIPTRHRCSCTYFDGHNRNWQCLTEYANSSATPDTTYIWGLRYVDDLICRTQNVQTLYPLPDPNWNVVALTDSAGNPVKRYTYTAFGKLRIYDGNFTSRSSSNYAWTRAFTGQVLDAETGLMSYRNRFYDQDLGRFLHRDPIGVVNLYWSVRNSPLLRTDASGLIDHLVTVKLPPDWTNCEVNCTEPTPSKGRKTAQPCKEADLKPSEDTACQTALAAVLNDPEVKDLLNRISKIGDCNRPNMECKCCGGNWAGAWHMGDSIYICDGQGHVAIRM